MKKTKISGLLFPALALCLAAQTVKVESPNGGENWVLGSGHTITWSQTGLSGTARLFLLKGTNQVGVIANNLAVSALQYSWTAGALLNGTAAAGGDYRVQIRVNDPVNGEVMDKSNQGFTLSQGGNATITVNSPKSGDQWLWNSTHAVQWSKAGTQAAKVNVRLFKGAAFILDIAAGADNDGSVNWTVPADLGGTDFTVKVQTTDNAVGGSSAPFRIGKYLSAGGLSAVALKANPKFQSPVVPLQKPVTISVHPTVYNKWYRKHQYTGFASASDPTPDPSPLMRTGYSNYYNGPDLFAPDWEYWGYIYRGILVFDLHEVKGRVTEARLSMQCTGSDSTDGAPYCDGSVFVLDSAGDGFNNARHHLLDLPAQGGNIANGVLNVAGPNIVIVLTDLVKAWKEGGQPNHGLLFLGNNEEMDNESNDRCLSHFQASLSVTYVPD